MARLPAVLAAALLLALARPAGADDAAQAIAVIVHPDRAQALEATELAQVYLRRRRFWGDNGDIVPLNLPADSGLRSRFVRRVLRQSDTQLADYWNRRYFDGVFPPATLASTQAVLRFVAGNRNAIGYVPLGAVDATVRVLVIID